jgi:hypothetical protein
VVFRRVKVADPVFLPPLPLLPRTPDPAIRQNGAGCPLQEDEKGLTYPALRQESHLTADYRADCQVHLNY